MPKFKCHSTAVDYQQRSLARLDRGMEMMRLEGIPELSTPFRALSEARSQLMRNIGIKMPRNVVSLLRLYGLSPGTIQLWHDDESGFFTEARATPGAPPIYKHISDDVAIVLLKGELTKELEEQLMATVDYLGE